MHNVRYLCASVIISFCLVGCGDQRILEKLGFIHTMSYDLMPKEEGQTQENLMISVSLPKADPEGKTKRETLTAIATTSKTARIKLSRLTELYLVSGQIRNTLYGINLAKKGLMEQIDTLLRDPSISQRVKVTVVNGNAHDLLIKDYLPHPRTGKYIDRMIEKESDSQNIPSVALYEFTRDLFDDGIDPVAPIIKEHGRDVIIDGIALFNEDRFITKIEPDKALIFAILRGNIKQGELSIDLKKTGRNEEHVMFSSLKSKRKIKVSSNESRNQFTIDINLTIKGSVLEYIGVLKLSEEKNRREIEKLISDYIKKESNEMIAKMQKNEVDSLGLGKRVRNSMSYSEWNNLNWKQVYPHVNVRCNVQIKIKNYGKFEKLN
ncbi:spore germination protein [Paenibacillus sp. yr247]|uniref:Ger(x)C family spore germination protein n=1 Tax=Paenibacillus sp. yr247 TaxID=1761880 RepID=UPI0008890E4D|nr:Ger(x)C family spore germination protein [Paenibacillus sp. yr247]SDN93681.1 spore germination protein [Paenibacillus sp. yr247]